MPGPLEFVLEQARGNDILLYSAGLAFYALVSIAPLVIMIMWVTSTVLGDDRVREFAQQIGRVAPEGLGADQALQRVADLGNSVGFSAILLSIWPATAYGSGLDRAFERLSPKRDRKMEGLRGRGLLLLVILPVLLLGSLLGSYLGSLLLGDGGVAQVLGWILALLTGFVGAAVGIILIFRIFPPERLSWRAILVGTAVTACGASILSLTLGLYLTLGADFQERYASSGVAGIVLLAVWLFLSNVMLLIGYRAALTTRA